MNHPTNPILDPKPSRNRWIIGAAIVGGLLFIGANSTDTATPTPDPKPSVTQSTPAPKPKPAPAPTQAEQFIEWNADVQPDLDTFVGHLSEPDLTDAGFRTLAADVDRLQAAGPCPYPAVDRHWQAALDSYDTGFALALDGDLAAATVHISEGNQHITDATDAIGTVTV